MAAESEEREVVTDGGGGLRREKMLELEVPESGHRRSCHLGHAL